MQTNITGPRQSFQPYRTRYNQTLPVIDNLFSLIGLDTNKHNRSSTIFLALSHSIQIHVTGPRQSFQPYRTRYKHTLPVLDNLFSLTGLDTTNITGPQQSFQPYRTRYKQTLPVLDNLFSLIGLNTNKHNRSSTILSVSSDSIQTNFIGSRQSFQPYRTRYKQTLPVHDNLFSLIGLDTNKIYRSSTIFSALLDSIQTHVTGPRQSSQSYRTRYKQTSPVLDNLFNLINAIQTNVTGYWTTITCYLTRSSTELMPAIGLQYRLILSSTKLMPAIGPQSLVTQPGPQRNSCRLLDYSTPIVPILNGTHAGYWTTITCYLTRSSTELMPAIGLQYGLIRSSVRCSTV